MFNIKRFGQVILRDLQSNRKSYVHLFLGFYIAYAALLGAIFYTPSSRGLPPGIEDVAWLMLMNSVRDGITVVSLGLGALSLSRTFSHLATKQQRISYLMLPATNLEKYLSRLVIHIPLALMAAVVALVMADLTRMAVMPMMGHSYGSVLPPLWESLCSWAVNHWEQMSITTYEYDDFIISGTWFALTTEGTVLALTGYWILISALFRRRAGLYGVFIFIGLCIAVGYWYQYGDGYFGLGRRTEFEGLMPLWAVLSFTIAIIETGLSYRLFTRIKVISPKTFR